MKVDQYDVHIGKCRHLCVGDTTSMNQEGYRMLMGINGCSHRMDAGDAHSCEQRCGDQIEMYQKIQQTHMRPIFMLRRRYSLARFQD